MKKKIILAALCSAGLIVGCNQSTEQATAADTDNQRSATLPAMSEDSTEDMDVNTLLTVNGQPVTRAMYSLYFQDRMRGVPDAKTSPEMQMGVLNELANILIVAQEAEKSGIQEREDVAASLKLLRAKLLTQVAIQEHAASHKPTDEEIQKIYDADFANQSNTEYKARHILVKEEEEAKSLITQLDSGSDFAELAKEHSTGPTGKNGGDLGWFDAGQMVAPFAEALKAMEKGKYTAAPVKTQFGWHVILLEDSRQSPAPTLESVRGKIETALQQKSLTQYMQGLRDSSKLVFNEKNAKPATEEKTDASMASSQQSEDSSATTDSASTAPAEEKQE